MLRHDWLLFNSHLFFSRLGTPQIPGDVLSLKLLSIGFWPTDRFLFFGSFFLRGDLVEILAAHAWLSMRPVRGFGEQL